MSNSSRIEQATRQHINAVLTTQQLEELVHLADPNWKGGIYPSDCAGQKLEDGTITHRGKQMYGDLVLLHLGSNSYRVLPTEQIIRRKNPPAIPAAPPAPAAKTEQTQPVAEEKPKSKKKAA
jgi:hypothetical protein